MPQTIVAIEKSLVLSAHWGCNGGCVAGLSVPGPRGPSMHRWPDLLDTSGIHKNACVVAAMQLDLCFVWDRSSLGTCRQPPIAPSLPFRKAMENNEGMVIFFFHIQPSCISMWSLGCGQCTHHALAPMLCLVNVPGCCLTIWGTTENSMRKPEDRRQEGDLDPCHQTQPNQGCKQGCTFRTALTRMLAMCL